MGARLRERVGVKLTLAAASVLLALFVGCSGKSTSHDAACPVGSEGCACTQGGACDAGLLCLSHLCVEAPASGLTTDSNAASGSGGATASTDTDTNTNTESTSGGGAPEVIGGTSGVVLLTTTSGAAGTSGTASTTTAATATTGGPATLDDTLFALECESDADCGDDLVCLSADSTTLARGGPAHGICTAPCTSTCNTLGVPAACLSFSSRGNYCMPLCGYGDGQVDCRGRLDLACAPLSLGSTGVACTFDTDCGASELCNANTCLATLSVCLPQCGADSQCPEGRFCDPWSGECVDTQPSGKGLLEPCDPGATTEECKGRCEPSSGRCIEECTLGALPSCGSEGATAATAICVGYGTYWEVGDIGGCVLLCDCSDDCPEGTPCVDASVLGETRLMGRPGICSYLPVATGELTCN